MSQRFEPGASEQCPVIHFFLNMTIFQAIILEPEY